MYMWIQGFLRVYMNIRIHQACISIFRGYTSEIPAVGCSPSFETLWPQQDLELERLPAGGSLFLGP